MARPKSATIKLTKKQREQIRSLTGVDHTDVKFEATTATLGGKSLAAKSAPSGGVPFGRKGTGGPLVTE